MPKLDRVLETALYVDDLGRASAFYAALFDLPSLYADDRLRAFAVGDSVLLLFRRGASLQTMSLPGGTIPPHDGSGPLHVAFAIGTEELAPWEERLRDRGIPVEGRTDWPQHLFPRSGRSPAGTRDAGSVAHLLKKSSARRAFRGAPPEPIACWRLCLTIRREYCMHEAEQHRQFVKRLHTLIHSELAADERADLARSAVLSYAAALSEAAVVAPEGELREGAYVGLHLTKAHNWLVAWRSLSDPVDPSTARVCDTAMQALDDQRRRLHPRAA